MRTVVAVPQQKRPTPTKIRNIRDARRIPDLPVRIDRQVPVRTVASPLLGLVVPAASVPSTVAVVRHLDQGRLHAPDLVDAAGWGAGQHLAVDVTRSGRVRITATTGAGSAIGTHRTHTDNTRRILIGCGVRHLLGLDVDSSVVAYLCAPGTVEIAATATLASAFNALDALDRLVAADASHLAARTGSLA